MTEASSTVATEVGPVDYMIVAFPGSEQQPLAAPAAPREPGYMAELEQLAQLRDHGIVSPEEFEAKKKQILGL